jgi:hypothetical protein
MTGCEPHFHVSSRGWVNPSGPWAGPGPGPMLVETVNCVGTNKCLCSVFGTPYLALWRMRFDD